MRGLSVQQVSKTFSAGAAPAVDSVSLQVPLASLVCFLGPSGCGKTTLLRMIAGLETVSNGRIAFDDRDLTELPAHRRSFGMVFQSLALFPHLNVERNITYSMKIAGRGRQDRRKRAQQLLELVRLPPEMRRRAVNQLSGGQRQRVAIARALAQEPRLLLLDEPMSALDAQLREDLQVELRRLQRRLKITTILVTHDQKEAMTMADTIVVMNQGRIEQVGPPLEIYRRPATLFVARFIGQSNLLPAEIRDGTIIVNGHPLTGVKPPASATDMVTLGIRPEQVRLFPVDQDRGAPNRIEATVDFIRDLGATVEVHLNSASNLRLISTLTPRDWLGFHEGDRVQAEFSGADCAVFPS